MPPRWYYALLLLLAVAGAHGCGTTKWSDSPRTATEQLLVSDAVDRAISAIDFGALSDRSVYLDTRFIETTLDHNYVVSTLRQHMLASGCIIKDKPEDSDFVVEVRAGSLGTNRNDVLLGVPATQLPSVGLLPTGAAAIPEIALSKRTSQQAVCKIAVFAYDRMSGRPVWQSGNRKVASSAKDTWLLGTGPFQRGSIYDGTSFAGEKLKVPLVGRNKKTDGPAPTSVGMEKRFDALRGENALDDTGRVEHVGYTEAAPKEAPPAVPATPPAAPAAAPQAPPAAPAAGPAAAPAAAAPAAGAPAPVSQEAAAGATPLPPDPNAGASVEPPKKAAYTPPFTDPAVKSAPAAGSGPQGELASKPLTPVVNPAVTTANAVQTLELAKDWLDR